MLSLFKHASYKLVTSIPKAWFHVVVPILCFISYSAHTQVLSTTYAPGDTLFLPAAGMATITVKAVGGGGSGGSGASIASQENRGGGGGGGYSSKVITIVSSHSYYASLVGSGGKPGDGGASRFKTSDSFLVVAQGGSSSYVNPAFVIGQGGPDYAGIGDIKYSGGNGGGASSFAGGGGGSAAGPSGNGVNGGSPPPFNSSVPGTGGIGGMGNGGGGGASFQDGINGSLYGGGGGGAGGGLVSPSLGGYGADGVIIIEYNNIVYALTAVNVNYVNNSVCNAKVTLTGTTSSLPKGSYTATFNVLGANAISNQTISFVVSTAGTAQFTLPSAYTFNAGSNQIEITKLESGRGYNGAALISTTLTTNNISNTFTQNPYLPVLNASNNMIVCEGNPFVLSLASSYPNYLWNPGSLTTSSINITSSNTYTVTVTDAQSCSATTSVSIQVKPKPYPDIVPDGLTTICPGSSVLLSAKNGAISFDGINDYIEDTTLIINPSAGFTIEGWMLPTNVNQPSHPYNALASKTLNNIPAPFDCYTNGTSFQFYVGNGSSYSFIGTPSNVLSNSWTHIACVYNATSNTIKIYINGIEKASGSVTSAVANAIGSTFRIGNRQDNATAADATLDEIRIWNSARTLSQIKASMNTTVPFTSNSLAGYYKMDDGLSAHTLNSVTGNFTGIRYNYPTSIIPSTSPLGYQLYSWLPGGATTSEIYANTNTTYTVTVTNSHGCTGTATETVSLNTAPTVTLAASTSTICPGESVTLTAGGASSYVIQPGGFSNPATVSPINTTTYTVTGTSANGCTATSSLTLTVKALPSVTITSTPGMLCPGSNAQLQASTNNSELATAIGSNHTGGGNVFNITATNTIRLHYFSMGITSGNSAQVWYKPGGYGCGSVTSNAGWILAGTAGITPAGASPNLTLIPIDLNVVIPAGQTYGFIVVCNGVNYYATGTAVCANQIGNSDFNLSEGYGGTGYGGLFNFTFNPRKFVGKVSYDRNSYSWSPTTFLSNPNIANPVIQNAMLATTYTVTTTSSEGCSNTATQKIEIYPTANPAISSNGPTSFCNGNSVSLSCATLAGTDLLFTASGQHVSVPYHASLDPANAITLEAWVKPTSLNGIQYLISRGNQDGLAGHYGVYLNNNQVVFKLGSSQLTSGNALTLNSWTHIACTWDGISQKIIINGMLDTIRSLTGSKPANTSNLRIGWLGASSPFQYPYLGEIDEIRIWNIGRSLTQISSNMNSPVPVNSNGLVAYFKLDEGSGNTTLNSVSGMTAGVISGNPTWNTNATAGYMNLQWMPNAVSAPTINVNSNNTYTVTVTTVNGCSATASQAVTVHPLPSPNITSNGPLSFCTGGSVQLNAATACVQLNGVNDYIEDTSLVMNPLLGFTVEGWMKTNSAGNNTLASFALNNLPAPFDIRSQSNSSILFLTGDGVNFSFIQTPSNSINTGSWNHIACVYDPSGAGSRKIYVNGILQASGTGVLAGNAPGHPSELATDKITEHPVMDLLMK